jgi:hypothetical protein
VEADAALRVLHVPGIGLSIELLQLSGEHEHSTGKSKAQRAAAAAHLWEAGAGIGHLSLKVRCWIGGKRLSPTLQRGAESGRHSYESSNLNAERLACVRYHRSCGRGAGLGNAQCSAKMEVVLPLTCGLASAPASGEGRARGVLASAALGGQGGEHAGARPRAPGHGGRQCCAGTSPFDVLRLLAPGALPPAATDTEGGVQRALGSGPREHPPGVPERKLYDLYCCRKALSHSHTSAVPFRSVETARHVTSSSLNG